MKQNKSPRQRHYASLHICAKKLDWDDDHYRKVFLRAQGAKQVNGEYSASTLNELELARAARAIQRLVKAMEISDWRDGPISKITAIWCAMADQGVIHNRSRQAMESWCLKQMKASKLEWASKEELNHIIETLKQWAKQKSVKLKP